jgi:hypothetical protein
VSFARIAIVDWSASKAPSPARPSTDAIWIGVAEVAGGAVATYYHRTRADAAARLHALAGAACATGGRLLVGADFPFGWPAGLAAALTGVPRALALWDWLAERIVDGPDNRNNRFAVAAAINAALPGTGPFWGRPAVPDLPDLPARGSRRRDMPFAERRRVEALVPRAQPAWKLYTTGAAGGQALVGIPVLNRLRHGLAPGVAVWPFEPAGDAAVVLAEVYPSLLADAVRQACAGRAAIRDEVQVRILAAALARMVRDGTLAAAMAPDAPPEVLAEEGWILGAGHAATLARAAEAAGLEWPPRHG